MPELQFKGKEFVYNHHLSVPYRPLVPDATKSVGETALSGNLIIHGDNLHALKALLPLYAGKVDCIFIDPPYNTGASSWNYNDNVNSQMMQEWLKSNPVNADDMLRHDKWLCLMTPRLKLLHELMADEAIIAITIDNNELARLWQLMDEIFGETSFVACAPWLSEPSGGKEKTGLRTGHEYVLIYSKGSPSLSQDEIDRGDLALTDQEGPYLKGRELRKWGGTSLREDRPGQWFALTAPDGSAVYPIRNDGKEGHWRWGKNNTAMREILKNPGAAHWEKRPFDPGVTWQGQTERWVPYEKIRESLKGVGWKTWLDNIGYNADGTRLIKEIFGEKVFDTPKPIELIEWIISLLPNDNAIVLDSFAGSGTTAHAVLTANQRDGGERKFILVECEDYAETITAERVRRVINGYAFEGKQKTELMREPINFTALKKAGKLLNSIAAIENLHGHEYNRISKKVENDTLVVIGEKDVEEMAEGLGGSFTYCTLGDPLDLDKMLTGESLPEFETLAAWLFHTATGQTLDTAQINKQTGFVGEGGGYMVWLSYQPDLAYLQSKNAALTLSLAEQLHKAHPDKRHLVFAPAKYVANKMLLPLGVDYAPLPWALYRLEKV